MIEEKSSLTHPELFPPRMAPTPQVSKEDIVGKVVEDQPSLGKMLIGSLFAGTVEKARKYVIENVFKPDIKAMLFNSLVGFMSVWIFDDNRAKYANTVSSVYRSAVQGGQNAGKTDYNQISAKGIAAQSQPVGDPSKVKSIVFETREDAEKVLADFLEVFDTLGYISVYKYYELAKIKQSEINYTQKDFGWAELPRDFGVHQSADGFYINVPSTALKLSRILNARGGRS